MFALQLLSVTISSLMLVLAPVLPCAMSAAAVSHSAGVGSVTPAPQHSCCSKVREMPDACPSHTQGTPPAVMRCCCGPTLATPPVKTTLDQAALSAPLAAAGSLELVALDRCTLADEPLLLRPPLVFLSVWRC
jgi:hypothetical protein